MNRGSIPVGVRDSAFLHGVQTGTRATQLPAQGYRGIFSIGGKGRGREAAHSPPLYVNL
jgi:hypothetical protein